MPINAARAPRHQRVAEETVFTGDQELVGMIAHHAAIRWNVMIESSVATLIPRRSVMTECRAGLCHRSPHHGRFIK